jgi:transposase InsO family protein
LYRWHPWFGLRVSIHKAVDKADGVVFRCSLNGTDADRRLEVPAWMFDRSACARVRVAADVYVKLSALTSRGRKRALGTRAPMIAAQLPNDRWSVDFAADQFIDGRRMRIFVVVDDCTRECLALIADTSISGIRVSREVDRLLGECGKPKVLVSDNGTELTSNAILRWADDHKIAWHYIDPGKPVQNAFAESFGSPLSRGAPHGATPDGASAAYAERPFCIIEGAALGCTESLPRPESGRGPCNNTG